MPYLPVFIGFAMIVGCLCAAPVPKTHSAAAAPAKPIPRTVPLGEVEVHAPLTSDLPFGVERRFIVREPDHIFCGPGDEFRVAAKKWLPGAPADRPNDLQVWKLWPEGAADRSQKMLEKFGPIDRIDFSADRSRALFTAGNAVRFIDFKTGKETYLGQQDRPEPVVRADPALTTLVGMHDVKDPLGLGATESEVELFAPGDEEKTTFKIPRAAMLNDLGPKGDLVMVWGMKNNEKGKGNFTSSVYKKEGTELPVTKDGDILLNTKFVASPDGKELAFLTRPSTADGDGYKPATLRFFDAATHKLKRELVVPWHSLAPIGYSNDGSLFFFESTTQNSDGAKPAVSAINLHSGESVPLPSDFSKKALHPCDAAGRKFYTVHAGAPLYSGQPKPEPSAVIDIVDPVKVVEGNPIFLGAKIDEYVKQARSNDPLAAWKAVRLLKGHLSPAEFNKKPLVAASFTAADKELLGTTGLRLGEAAFAEREKANDRLIALINTVSYEDYAKVIVPALQKAILSPDAEVRRRAETTLEHPRPVTADAKPELIQARLNALGK